MTRVFNFSAGPAALPEPVLRQAAAEMLDWQGTGMSVMEMSHRSPAFMGIAAQAQALLRELLAVPATHRILFMQGGALAENAIVPMNLLGGCSGVGRADYVDTGWWSGKSIAEARRYGRVNVAASSAASGHTTVPARDTWQLDPQAAYVHLCSNETIGGVQYADLPDTGPVPLVVDMSSEILSRPVDWARVALAYAGAQKNIGPAGLTLVIVRDGLLTPERALPSLPTAFNYRVVADNDSMYNTPPTYAIYIAGLVFQWIRQHGGVPAMAARNAEKAALLYGAIDGPGSSGFYRCPVERGARSRMNVVFRSPSDALDAAFVQAAQARGLVQLKGHRVVGGLRASIYNAMPLAGVQALVGFMRDFEASHG
jgi:phosphoserine aminotransferase